MPSVAMGWKIPEGAVATASGGQLRVSAIISHPCPACHSLAVHRSHARRLPERIRKKLSSKRPYRCEQCGWRGWCVVPDIASYQSLVSVNQPARLESIDGVPSRGHAVSSH